MAALPKSMNSILESIKSLLYLPNYGNALLQVSEANDWIETERYVDNYRLDSRGPTSWDLSKPATTNTLADPTMLSASKITCVILTTLNIVGFASAIGYTT